MIFTGNGVSQTDRCLFEILRASLLERGAILQSAGRNCGEHKFEVVMERRGEEIRTFLQESALYSILNTERVSKITSDLANYFVVAGHTLP